VIQINLKIKKDDKEFINYKENLVLNAFLYTYTSINVNLKFIYSYFKQI